MKVLTIDYSVRVRSGRRRAPWGSWSRPRYFYSDVVLLVEIAIAFMLIVGMFVVRRGHIRAHMYIQSSMVLVNIPIVLIWMVPEYTQWVLPGSPTTSGSSSTGCRP